MNTDAPNEATEAAAPALKRRRFLWVALVVLIAVCGAAIKYGRHHVFAKRFAVVVPGELYRSGLLKPWPLERVIREHKIKTVLTLLAEEPDDAEQIEESAILHLRQVGLLRIAMPGDGCADFDRLEAAAAVIADASHRPLLVHCAAGVNRTGAALAVWRMKYCDWDVGQALTEAARHGMTSRSNPELCEHLRSYYATRIGQQAGDP